MISFSPKMAETNFFCGLEIYSLKHTAQNPLHLLAEAAFISENKNDTNKLLKHNISPSHYSECSTSCSDYSQEIFTETASNCSTNLTDNNDDIELNNSSEQIKTDYHTNIKTISEINNSKKDDCLNSDLNSSNLFNNDSKDLTFNPKNLTLSDDSFSTSTSDLGKNSNCSEQNNHNVKNLIVKLKYNKERVPKSVVNKNQHDKNLIRSFSKDKKIITKRKRAGSHNSNTENSLQRLVRSQSSQPYVTRSNRISKPPSSSLGGRWTGS